MKLSRGLFPLIAFVLIALPVLAHDAWVEPAGGTVFHIYYGHKIPEPYEASKVTSLKVYDAAQKKVNYTQIKTKEGVDVKTAKGKPALFVLDFDNGYWVRMGGESHNVPKDEVKDGDASHPYKCSKTMLNWQPWMAKPQGQHIEFVPVGITALPAAGSALRLQLLVDGKPVGGQMVENNSNETGPKTDSDGFVTVTVIKGVNRFATDYDVADSHDPVAKRVSLTATLVFAAN